MKIRMAKNDQILRNTGIRPFIQTLKGDSISIYGVREIEYLENLTKTFIINQL